MARLERINHVQLMGTLVALVANANAVVVVVVDTTLVVWRSVTEMFTETTIVLTYADRSIDLTRVRLGLAAGWRSLL